MRGKSVFKLVVIILAVVLLAVFVSKPIAESIPLGLDLKGGVHVVLEAVDTPEAPVTDDSIKRVQAIMRNRVDSLGVSEPVIQPQGDRRIIVELADVDPDRAIELIGKTAVLEFRTQDGKTVLTGKHLKNARAEMYGQKPQVHLEFDEEGAEIFGRVTTENVNRVLAIFLDDELLTAPTIGEPITTGDAVIHGNYESLKDAEEHAVLLRSGSLPVELQMIEKRTVGPTLGQDSLEKSFKAGLIGIVAIFLFMIFYYRLPGVVAVFSLVLYGILLLVALAGINATLTLPGIAGFILSFGIAVDANIIIYERLKEELRHGKTLKAAIDAGFKRAFRTIIDANVTTLLATAILYYFGSGPVQGFAVTLAIGIVASMFTAITFTRYMLQLFADSRLVVNPKMYGA